MDVYKQSFHEGPLVNASLTKRMSWVYRKAGLAMLITSLTTACAFVVTAMSSPLPTLQNFGVFAAFVILLDYALVMTLLCSSVVVYHNLFEVNAAHSTAHPVPLSFRALFALCAALLLSLC